MKEDKSGIAPVSKNQEPHSVDDIDDMEEVQETFGLDHMEKYVCFFSFQIAF